MATPSITPQSVSALRKVFALLEDHFDPAKGCYSSGYSDERIAKETNISVDGVKKYRVDGFGKLLPPSEVAQIAIELRELETLHLKMDVEIKDRLKDLKARLSQVQRRFD